MYGLTDERKRGARRAERGQVIIMLVGVLTVFFVVAAVAVDFGLWLAERRAAQRAADLAAAAGAQDLLRSRDHLADDNAAIASVYEWAARNGFDEGVEVELLCNNTLESGSGICTNANPPGAGPGRCAPGEGCDSLRVTISKPAQRLFTSIFGIDDIHVEAGSTAGVAVESAVLDVVLVMDDTWTMLVGCGQTGGECPIEQARDGANVLLDIIKPGSAGASTHGALVPFRGCYSDGSNRYNPISGRSAHYGCVIQDEIIDLTTDRGALRDGVEALRAGGGFPGTNLCLGMYEGFQRLVGTGARPTAHKVMVVLTDGDNRYGDGAESEERNLNADATQPVPGVYPTGIYPDAQGPAHLCRPEGPVQDVADFGADYDQIIDAMDARTYDLSRQLEDAGVEIYVLRFSSPAGDLPPGTPCAAGLVGTGGAARQDSNDARDQNLARCVSSSTSGTDDHYFYAPAAQDLPALFELVAWEIVGRGLVE